MVGTELHGSFPTHGPYAEKNRSDTKNLVTVSRHGFSVHRMCFNSGDQHRKMQTYSRSEIVVVEVAVVASVVVGSSYHLCLNRLNDVIGGDFTVQRSA